MSAVQIALILDLLQAGETIDMPLWLESGWAVDARLGRTTREHGDIDLAVPYDRMGEFVGMLKARGAGAFEETDYGFLVYVGGILLDCEPCVPVRGVYHLEGMPPASLPLEKQGRIGDVGVRCASWQAILWEYFHYLREVPYVAWPVKDRENYRFIRAAIGELQADAWQRDFLAVQGDGM